ncbi:hypothetical protein TanjilG_11108 [Lupinus angustifolius]|uniref:Uncharacterized protein n=1 Tax=Lupinus angustifolius TaxID=3871 RepID=A0A394DJD3_LUPAN|nr:hypothetical protein TanjilG_11108 [Lupinus angustifolius]
MTSLQENLLDLDEESLVELEPETHSEKPGWKAMPYILGNDTAERLATFGIQANFMVYLMREYNMDQVFASNIFNTWNAVSNFAPLIGAFVADSYLGKLTTIGIASFASMAGIVMIMLTAAVPQFHPRHCSLQQQQIGTGGIRPCSIPFAVDQFDMTTVEGRQGSRSFYNIYYTTQTLILLFNQTLLVYIQDSVSWTIGFGLPCLFIILSIIAFFSGIKVYHNVKPGGSIFSTIAQVLVAAKHNRHLHLPYHDDNYGAFYDPLLDNDEQQRLPLTNEFRCLNKAALMVKDENIDESNRNPWRLCSVQQVEELKCLLKIMPIWVTSIIVNIPIAQQGIFPISQALKMDRHFFGTNFEIPAGSISSITLVTIGIFLPFYDKIIAPGIEKITMKEGGLTTLQRIGLGHVCGILSMLFVGLVEIWRRDLANSSSSSDGVAPLSVMWLAPQFMFIALSHVFQTVGHTEFFNKESPTGMRSIANSLLCLNVACASYVSSIIINIVHGVTMKYGQHDWLDNDINKGRLENFYFIIAGLGVLNLCYFIFCARRYSYVNNLKPKLMQ